MRLLSPHSIITPIWCRGICFGNGVASSCAGSILTHSAISIPPLSLTPSRIARALRSEEHTSELQSLMRISYAVFCLKKKSETKTVKLHNNILVHPQHDPKDSMHNNPHTHPH